MGGERDSSKVAPSEQVSSAEQGDIFSLCKKEWAVGGGLRSPLQDASVDEENSSELGEFDDLNCPISAYSSDFELNRRRRSVVYGNVLRSYDELRSRSESLEEDKNKILSYSPGVWIDNVSCTMLSDYDVPTTTCLLLVGPKGCGKSSLINRISRVFEDEKFSSERAQVSYNSAVGDGTYFLQEYMIPRGSTSLCLYDTRSLSDASSENLEMLKRWMTEGVCHGEPVVRNSDDSSLQYRMKCKSRLNGYYRGGVRKINFVIFVVSGVSILKSMNGDSDADATFSQMIATAFNCPFLSFRDDKPAIVVTHGDLLSLFERTRIRVYLGELLGVSPLKQIFDIPDNCDAATELAIVDMLRYALEHADRNLPRKHWLVGKVCAKSVRAFCFILLAVGIAVITAQIHGRRTSYHPRGRPTSNQMDWHAIRHMWLGPDND